VSFIFGKLWKKYNKIHPSPSILSNIAKKSTLSKKKLLVKKTTQKL
jgi:hypothetical protein